MSQKPATIDAYISEFPETVQEVMLEIRKVINELAPTAEECINYGMPTWKLNGNLVHFAAYQKHIGFYPTPSGISAFQDEIEKYKWAKGSVQFPLNKPMPLNLISRITAFRVKESSSQ
ncbi:MAG: DUF1801 domain-containing protein [Cyclobacteriaceae bacterium]